MNFLRKMTLVRIYNTTLIHTYVSCWKLTELGTRQFLASRQRQRDNVIVPQGQEKIGKISRSRNLDGVATMNTIIMQQPTFSLGLIKLRITNIFQKLALAVKAIRIIVI